MGAGDGDDAVASVKKVRRLFLASILEDTFHNISLTCSQLSISYTRIIDSSLQRSMLLRFIAHKVVT